MNDFVPLKMQILALEELQKSLSSRENCILLVGKSGLGKSFLLNKLCKDEKVTLFSQPFFDENAFCKALCGVIGEKDLDFESLYNNFKNSKKAYVFVCDEVGMYEENLLEKIRILSDLPQLCFILSTHKKQGIFNKEHFASRIHKEIWLKSLNLDDLSLYVKEKFTPLKLDKRQLKWLLKISDSNLRNIDKILITFQKLFHFYAQEKQAKSAKNILKMSALHHKLLSI